MRKAFLALPLLMLLTIAGHASAQTDRTLTLGGGDTITPASPVTDATGNTVFFGGFVYGGVAGSAPGTFTFSLAFRGTGPVEGLPGVYGGTIIAPNSSFAVTEAVGRKSRSTSGTVDAGTVTYSLTPDGRAEIISVVSGSLTIWEGKNSRRKAVGNGTLDYGTATPGGGTLVLNYF